MSLPVAEEQNKQQTRYIFRNVQTLIQTLLHFLHPLPLSYSKVTHLVLLPHRVPFRTPQPPNRVYKLISKPILIRKVNVPQLLKYQTHVSAQ